MLFNSIEFIIFLAVVLSLYYSLRFRAQNTMLLAASYFFYGWWDPKFLFLIVLSSVVDYGLGLLMDRGKLTRNQRLIPSTYLLVSAFLFLGLDWQAINWSGIDWGNILSSEGSNWGLIAATVAGLIVINFVYPFAQNLTESKRRKAYLITSLVTNLGILGFFKYFGFFVGSVQAGLASLGLNLETSTLNIILPVGISFYTFQTLSYSIDIYRGKLKPTDNFLDFALFVAYFPQLVAGPIERASHLLPELSKARTVEYSQITRGLFLILFGLFKKVCVADGVASSVNSVFNSTGSVTWADIIAASVLFAIQIYCDFSGYSDIARGTSKLLGIDLMTNFNLPYVSRNPSEFWQRWHISLSSWLRDYLYIPLGGSRSTTSATSRNLMVTMLLGGLWHGAAWNYVLWGFYQGFVLMVYRVLGIPNVNEKQPPGIPLQLIMWVIFFAITCYGWLLFRANSFEQIAEFTRILFVDFGNLATDIKRPTLAALIGISILTVHEALQFKFGTPLYYRTFPAFIRGGFYASLLFLLAMGTSNAPSQFIYFQF